MAKEKKEEREVATQENTETIRQMGRIIAGSFYDMQQVRISTMSRIRDVIRKKREGIPFDAVEEKKEDGKEKSENYTDEELLDLLKEEMVKGNLTQKELDYVERCLTIAYESNKVEAKYKLAMEDYIQLEPVYIEFLSKIRGIGTILSCNLLKEFGYCETYDYSTKLWAHCGLNTVGGVAPKKRAGQELHFSPRLRTLTWKISDCLMKNNRGIYRQVYDTEKQRQLNKVHPKGELFQMYGKPYTEESINLSKLHAHNRALRKSRKLFLAHYWECAREIKGLPTPAPYVQEKLGHQSIIGWKKAVSMENWSAEELKIKAQEMADEFTKGEDEAKKKKEEKQDA